MIFIKKSICLRKEVVRELIKVKDNLFLNRNIKNLINNLTNTNNSKEAYLKLKEILEPDPEGFKLLYCYLQAALLSHNEFNKLNIPENIYISTMKAFTRLLKDDKKRFGKYTFRKGWWLYKFTSATFLESEN